MQRSTALRSRASDVFRLNLCLVSADKSICIETCSLRNMTEMQIYLELVQERKETWPTSEGGKPVRLARFRCDKLA